MEARVCLSSLTFPFQAANYSDRDGFGAAQPATNNIRSVQFTKPEGYDIDLSSVAYLPSGHGGGGFQWPEPKIMSQTRPDGSEVQASAFSLAGVGADMLVSTDRAATLDSVAQQQIVQMQGDNWFVTGPPVDHDITWSIEGGGHNGRTVTLHGKKINYRNDTLFTSEAVVGSAAREYLFYAGHVTTGFPQFFKVFTQVGTSIFAAPPDIPMAQAAATLLGAGSAAAHDQQVLNTIESGLKFTGAIPDTLFLYDFSAADTVPPQAVHYINQYEQSMLPPRYGVRSGAACGPSSLVMALEEVSTGISVLDAFNNTMTPPVPDPDPQWAGENSQAFSWEKGETYARSKLPASRSALYREYDTWGDIDANLDAGSPVIMSTKLGEGTGPGTGHVMLLMGVGRDPLVKDALTQLYGGGDYYIVSDPAGHYFGDAITGGYNRGHYGTVAGLRALAKAINYGGWFAIYPKEQLRNRVETTDASGKTVIRTLTIRPVQPAAKIGAHSPVSVVVTDPLGRRSGIRPDGSILDEIPGGGYQVAVNEEFGGALTYAPDEEKGVVITRPVHGTYQVQLVGTGTGSYTLDVDLLQPGAALATTTFAGTIVPGEVKNYSFTFPPSGAPAIERVYLSGSSWTPSFKQALATGSAGSAQFGFALPAADQLDERPWANADQISVTFDRDVVVDASDLRVTGVGTPVYPLDPAAFTYVPATRTATWRLAGGKSFRNDRILLDLDGDGPNGVKTAAGVFLDGDWINPVGAAAGGDAFPSGDDTPGGDFRFRFNVLAADVDRNGRVNAADVVTTRARQGAGAALRPAAYSIFHDIDGDGAINLRDSALVRAAHGAALPAGIPAAPAPLVRRQPPVRALLLDAP